MSALVLSFPSGARFSIEQFSTHHIQDNPTLEISFAQSGLNEAQWNKLQYELLDDSPEWTVYLKREEIEPSVEAGLDGVLRLGNTDFYLPASHFR